MMDIKKTVEDIISKIKNDKSFATNFQKDPVKALESVLGIGLPDDQVNAIIGGVKAKLATDNAEGTINRVKNLFKK